MKDVSKQIGLLSDLSIVHVASQMEGKDINIYEAFILGWLCGKYNLNGLSQSDKEYILMACEEYDEDDVLKLDRPMSKLLEDIGIF